MREGLSFIASNDKGGNCRQCFYGGNGKTDPVYCRHSYDGHAEIKRCDAGLAGYYSASQRC